MDRREAPLYSEASAAGAHLAELLPPVIGHRGAAASAPENTLAGLRKAWQLDTVDDAGTLLELLAVRPSRITPGGGASERVR